MAHELEDEIICPYCDEQYATNICDYYDRDGDELECDNCEKEFTLTVENTITVSTYKKQCLDNKHNYGDPSSYRDSDGHGEVKCKDCDKENWVNDEVLMGW